MSVDKSLQKVMVHYTHSAGNSVGEEAMNCPSLTYVAPSFSSDVSVTVVSNEGAGGRRAMLEDNACSRLRDNIGHLTGVCRTAE